MTARQKRGLIFILAGFVMVFAAMGLHLTEQRQDELAGENAQILLQQLELEQVAARVEVGTGVPVTGGDLKMPDKDAACVSTVTEMPEKEFYGYAMIGTIRVPSVGITLPVLSKWSYSLLNVAPCRYSGSIPGEDMILMGHNYKSHFTPLHGVEEGAQVEFEDVNGVVYRYSVAEIEVVHRSEKEKLESDFPLTLFTCMPNGRDRILIRCEAAEET